MITEVFSGLFQLKIPFPNNPLRDINIYVVKDGDRSLMIDNGIDHPIARYELIGDLKKIGVDLHQTAFFITHYHIDHCSNTPGLADLDSLIYVGKNDIGLLGFGSPETQAQLTQHANLMGLPNGNFFGDDNPQPVHPMFDFAAKRGWKFILPADGDVIQAGDYTFTCLETPGHSKGHLCLYEMNQKFLLCGDHILQDVTPVIFSLYRDENPIGDYFASLDKVYQLDITLALPGHRSFITDIKNRIREIKQHHEERLNEVLRIVAGDPLNAYQIASKMHWDVAYKSWEQFPGWQRAMATFEAEAHLRYLSLKHQICERVQGENIIFFLSY